jgi:hypothetical protein
MSGKFSVFCAFSTGVCMGSLVGVGMVTGLLWLSGVGMGLPSISVPEGVSTCPEHAASTKETITSTIIAMRFPDITSSFEIFSFVLL